jgi:hypothetical protein
MARLYSVFGLLLFAIVLLLISSVGLGHSGA